MHCVHDEHVSLYIVLWSTLALHTLEIEGLQLQLMAARKALLESRAAHRATELEHKWVRGGGAVTAPVTSQHSG
jgi:hypothetical protein